MSGLLLQTALQQGADVVIQSTHKTLSALTQASMLHVQGQLIDNARISSALEILQAGHMFGPMHSSMALW